MARFCSQCGSPLKDTSLFCPKCGTKVMRREPVREQQPAQAQQPVRTQKTVQPAVQHQQYHYAVPNQDKGKAVQPQPQYAQPQYQQAQQQQQYQQPQAAQPVQQQYTQPQQQYTHPQYQQPQPHYTGQQYNMPQTSARSAYPQPVQQRPQSNVKAPRAAISLLLIAVMIAEVVVSGLWYPGFFTGGVGTSGVVSGGGTSGGHPIAANVSPDGTGFEDMLEEFYTTSVTNDLALRYTDRQVASAPSSTVSLTTEGGTVTAGAVTAKFSDYLLDEDCDLIVKELPVLTEDGGEEADIRLAAYDLSLSSGQHEFASEVTVDIPRTVGEHETGSVIWFNDEMNRWENLYSEVSEDGKSYRFYTTHFTKFAEKKYIFNPETLTVSEGAVNLPLDKGIFYRNTAHGANYYDQTLMWAQANLKSSGDIDRLASLFEQLYKAELSGRVEKLLTAKGNSVSTYCGAQSTAGGWIDAQNLTKLSKTSKFLSFAGKFCAATDIILTFVKVMYEMKNNAVAEGGYWNSFVQACNNHALDITSGITAIAGFLAGSNPVGIALFVVGTVVFGLSIYDSYFEKKKIPDTLENKWKLGASNNDIYKTYEGFYHFFTYYMTLSFDGEMGADCLDATLEVDISSIPGMSDVEYQRFVDKLTRLNKKNTDKNQRAAHLTVRSRKDWVNVLQALLWACTDPGNLEKQIDGFFTMLASQYWNLSKDGMNDYLAFLHKNRTTNGVFDITPALNAEKNLSESEKNTAIAAAAELLKREYLPLIQEAGNTLIHGVFSDYLEEMERMIKYLDSYMVFTVTDTNAENFTKSAYCIDYMDIPGNEEKWQKPGASLNDLYLPMRFHGVTKSLFTPLIQQTNGGLFTTVQNYPLQAYYPYNKNYCPNASHQGSLIGGKFNYDSSTGKEVPNVVFSCTVYDYLMMGAPVQMDFYNPADYNADNPRHITVDLNFPKADVTPGEDIVVTATITSGNNQWFADQIVYNPERVTLDLDEKTALNKSKNTTADLPPLEFTDPLEFAPVVAKGSDTDIVYFVSFYYTGINKNYDKDKATTLLRNGKCIADHPDEQIKTLIPDPNASDAFYVVVYFYNTEAPLWEAYGIRYVSSYSMGNNYEPEVIEKLPYDYGENGSWKPKTAGEE